ncbi:uncharacterized protein METZ01_LOCUS151491 [marine metagenome]|uniref:Uncharacterized protein n=1 Tax=marine metagenome TaxID=408172 RepID=A0A382ACC0_9ZZZZ
MYQLINRLPFFYGWTILFAAGSSMVVRNATASCDLDSQGHPYTTTNTFSGMWQ